MLIVNMAGHYIAKVAFKGNVKEEYTHITHKVEFANNQDGYTPIDLAGKDDVKKTVEKLIVFDMEVVTEQVEEEPTDWFEDRFSEVKRVAEEDARKTTYTQRPPYQRNSWETGIGPKKDTPVQSPGFRQKSLYDDMDNDMDGRYSAPIRSTKILDMSDAEWEKFNSEQDTIAELDNITREQCYKLINSVLSNNMETRDYSNPLHAMKKYNHLIAIELDEKAEEILIGLQCNIEALFPGCSDEWVDASFKFMDDNIFDTASTANRMASALSRIIKKDLLKRDRGTNGWKPLNNQAWVD
jgi:hypothetical protein